MSISIKTRLKDSIIAIARRLDLFRGRKCRVQIARWQEAGKHAPPSDKRTYRAGLCFNLRSYNVIETGTYLGDILYVVKDIFPLIPSIELSKELWKRSKNRLRFYPHIRVWQGDSTEVLPYILSVIFVPAYWLNGHYSVGI